MDDKQMNYNPEIHNRQSYRMPKWDYSKGGKYYITICTRDRICCFGDVVNGEMKLNDMGKIASHLWLEIPEHFSDTWLNEYVIMPNHIHGIVVMKRSHLKNGGNDRNDVLKRNVGTLHATSLHAEIQHAEIRTKNNWMSQISPKSGALNTIIRSFKSACTKKFNETGFQWNGWQPRFYDEIIRSDSDLKRISEYIRNNPQNWKNDEYYSIL